MRHLVSHGSHYLAVIAICALAVRPLAGARWPLRHPALGIAAWQALLVSMCSAGIGLALSAGLTGYGTGELAALWRLGTDLGAGVAPPIEAPQWTMLALAALLAGGLATALGRCAVATAAARRRHRHLLDLAGEHRSDRFVTLEHPLPIAYCVPGRPSRTVISTGALAILDSRALEAVLAHERAHAAERHDLVLLPFAAFRAARLPGAARALAAVALLVECRADDRAAQHVGRSALRRALSAVSAHPVPAGALGVTVVEGGVRAGRGEASDAMLAARLQRAAAPLPTRRRTPVVVALTVLTVASTPWSLLAYPW